jgi:hypothetical protein
VAGCCECGDEPSGSCATELVITILLLIGSRPLNTTDFVFCTDIVWYRKRLWIYLRVLFESLPCLTKLLSMTMVGVASVV